ncbi:Protein CBR-THN-6 [Caenorhabditis briggsae]|uniref:Protein CBR-THN-6 n=1 Tax=Caenorhabditis briggsae TaxID=6238 RepID=A8XX34_CAEBR|nr:Protein CBR-THN-6 [Caenorhabditis briggsae]CAP37203.2 Protein CBR-THN-6 [Caenorhabditis briggsae]
MIFLLIAFLFPLNSYYCIRQINIYNRCPFPVWPGIVGPGNPAGGGFRLDNEQDRKISVEDSWQGIIWGRTFCDSRMRCATGNCGNREQCNGTLGRFPFTIAEFSLDESNDKDVYSVSLINGYNIPILIEPFGGKDCQRAGGCISDINEVCPERMRITNGRRRENGNVVGADPLVMLFDLIANVVVEHSRRQIRASEATWLKHSRMRVQQPSPSNSMMLHHRSLVKMMQSIWFSFVDDFYLE